MGTLSRNGRTRQASYPVLRDRPGGVSGAGVGHRLPGGSQVPGDCPHAEGDPGAQNQPPGLSSQGRERISICR